MDTASCFKKRQMNEYEKDLQKATEKKYENCDASFNLLKKENEVLLKHIEKQNKRNKDITDEKTTSVISVFHITITYTILLIVIGLFYNSLLTSSIIKILNDNIKLVDFLNNENHSSYNAIWAKLLSCLNNFRFYLFIVIFVSTLLINVGIVYKIILNGKNVKNAFIVVSIASLAVIGVTSLLTSNVSFITIFENTLGYAVATSFSPKKDHSFTEFINSLFAHDTFGKGGIDFSFLFTAFRLDNLGDIIRDIGTKKPESKYDFYLKTDNGLSNDLNNDLNLLAKAVVLKNTVGSITWSLFATITATIISIKYLSRNI